MRIEVMRGHTKSLDANDKLIQTRSHVRNAIASRGRQVVMRKVKSTIQSSLSCRRFLLWKWFSCSLWPWLGTFRFGSSGCTFHGTIYYVFKSFQTFAIRFES